MTLWAERVDAEELGRNTDWAVCERCIAQVGALSPLTATVVWRHADDDGTMELGLKFDE